MCALQSALDRYCAAAESRLLGVNSLVKGTDELYFALLYCAVVQPQSVCREGSRVVVGTEQSASGGDVQREEHSEEEGHNVKEDTVLALGLPVAIMFYSLFTVLQCNVLDLNAPESPHCHALVHGCTLSMNRVHYLFAHVMPPTSKWSTTDYGIESSKLQCAVYRTLAIHGLTLITHSLSKQPPPVSLALLGFMNSPIHYQCTQNMQNSNLVYCTVWQSHFR